MTGSGCLLAGGALGYALHGDAPRRPGAQSQAVHADGSGHGAAGLLLPPVIAGPPPGAESASDAAGQTAHTADFPAKMVTAMGNGDEWDRLRQVHATIDRMTPAELAVAAHLVQSLPSGEHWTVAWVLGEHWAQFDPAAALAFAKQLPSEDGRALREGAFQKWVASSPAAARAWITALPDQKESAKYVQDFAGDLARQDPAGTLQMLQTFAKGGDAQGNAYYYVFDKWAASDPQAAAAAASTLPMGRSRTTALDNIAEKLGLARPRCGHRLGRTDRRCQGACQRHRIGDRRLGGERSRRRHGLGRDGAR